MALNATFDGFVFDEDGILGNSDIYYQALFYPSTTASSPSKWNSVRLIESSGYYSCNLGDNDFLGQDGTALPGAKVIIVFWKGATDRNTDCTLLVQWGTHESNITGASFYTQDAQIKSNILPTLSWYHNIPAHAYVNTNYNISNNSDDTHSWEFNDITMYHWYQKYGHNINTVNVVAITDYLWGNGESELDLLGASNTSYQWDTAGTYEITIIIEDACGEQVSGSTSVDIFWHAPSPNIVRCDSTGNTLSNIVGTPDTEVFFKYSGSDTDSTITSIDWIINDGDTDTTVTKNNSTSIVVHTEGEGTSWIAHSATPGAFTNSGNHLVEIVVHWFDGHDSQVVNYSENFTQERFNTPPSANITCNEAVSNTVSVPSTVLTFNYTGTNPDSRIVGLNWLIEDSGYYGGTDTLIVRASPSDTVLHINGKGGSWCGNEITLGSFTNPGSHLIEITVYWNDGWDINTVNYSEIFTQSKFFGPVIDFAQSPAQAGLLEYVTFSNNSSSTDRVGLGPPNCEEYTWTWIDTTVVESEANTTYEYEFTKVPITARCSVKLCADWSDGWETNTTCLTKDVVFNTTITVSPEDCYYALDIIGTSSDGTVSAYSWTVSSGVSEDGPWSQVWESPIDIYQQSKTLCFTLTGWYRIDGFVHGSGETTSAYETMFISESCPDTAAIYNIWNGTGVLDIGTDWLRDGVGIETLDSKYRGTNGLDINVAKNEQFTFYRNNYSDMDLNNYDFLSFWINIKRWDFKNDVHIKLFSSHFSNGEDIALNHYIAHNSLNTWTKVLIPLDRFKLKPSSTLPGWPTMVNKIRFHVKDEVQFWLDNVSFSMGSLVSVPVCSPTVQTTNLGEMAMHADNLGLPTPTVTDVGVPGGKSIGTIQPSIKVINIFPEPINL